MRTFIYLVILIYPSILFAQCKVQFNKDDNGITMRYIAPDRVGHSDKLFLGLSMQANDEQYFVATISIFETNAIKLKGNLVLKFSNNKSSTFQHLKSEYTTFNDYPAVISIFNTSDNSLSNITNSNIQMAVVQLENGLLQSVPVVMNSGILKNQYLCLREASVTSKPNTNIIKPDVNAIQSSITPSLEETKEWILNKLNNYQKSVKTSNGVNTSFSNYYTDFKFSFSNLDLIIKCSEVTNLKDSYGGDNTWKNEVLIRVPICDCTVYAPYDPITFYSKSDRSLGFSSPIKIIQKNEQGQTEYVSSFEDILIDYAREKDLSNRLQLAFSNLKKYCPINSKPKEVF